MARNQKECPYFIEMSRQVIKCKGIAVGSKMQQGYTRADITKEHYADCCCKNYHTCTIAQMINEVWHEYEVHVCPYNSEVDCLHEDECCRCGWNPVVAEYRLRKFLIKCKE